MIRKTGIILAIAFVHFVAILGLTFAGLNLADGASAAGGWSQYLTKAVVWASRILYFPIVTMSLFPRNAFPGSLVYIPILLNSLIWGIFLYAIYHVVDRLRD